VRVVVAHGNVDEYCAAHGLQIGGRYDGDLRDYNLKHPIVVTDSLKDKGEYYYMKYLFLKRGLILMSIYDDDDDLRSRSSAGGRAAFGFRWNGGVIEENPEAIVIARRVIALRDQGYTYKKIQEDEGVHHLDGSKMSISTIQVILKNRRKYQEL
jgi:hypothetical protein